MSQLSTQNLSLLPSAVELQRICKGLSALEAIICPEWEYRYYSYQKKWSEFEEFCGMRNGHGDRLLILFNESGCCINGFAHESAMNGWRTSTIRDERPFLKKLFGSKNKSGLTQEIYAGVVDELPVAFHDFVFGEPVKSIGTTFCIWQLKEEKDWKIGNIQWPDDAYKDGSTDLLELLDGNPQTYKNWAESYYDEQFDERPLSLPLVEKMYSGTALTSDMVKGINPDLEDFESLISDLNEIGYAHAL